MSQVGAAPVKLYKNKWMPEGDACYRKNDCVKELFQTDFKIVRLLCQDNSTFIFIFSLFGIGSLFVKLESGLDRTPPCMACNSNLLNH